MEVNSTATALWHIALKRQGLDRGLLAGNVVVVLDEPEGRRTRNSRFLYGQNKQKIYVVFQRQFLLISEGISVWAARRGGVISPHRVREL
jgi:hypothetical protein